MVGIANYYNLLVFEYYKRPVKRPNQENIKDL